MKTVCDLDQCTGCMACVDICPKNAIKVDTDIKKYNAVIDESKCVNCDGCRRVCQKNHPPVLKEPIMWKQGWSDNAEIRAKASSGGAATSVMKAFVQNGGVVCSCMYDKRSFKFSFAENIEEINRFIGSKYVKSDATGAYKTVKQYLKHHRKVLFLGLPCQVGAVKNYVGEQLAEYLYTADLICHGTPSPELFGLFLKQYHPDDKRIKDIQFRKKNQFQVSADGKNISVTGTCDKYSIGFLNCLFYTENCYDCYYAAKKRVSDLTLGDSWGSELPISEQRKGLSLVICQTEKGKELLNHSDLKLQDVDVAKAIEHNHQLEHPSVAPESREKFYNNIRKGKSFDHAVRVSFPYQCFKQFVKKLLIKTGLLKK